MSDELARDCTCDQVCLLLTAVRLNLLASYRLGRVSEWRRTPQNWNELNMLGDYHLPFGKAEARAEAAKWLCQV